MKRKSQQDTAINAVLPQCVSHLITVLAPEYSHLSRFSPEEARTTLRKNIRREADNVFLFHADQAVILHIEVQATDQKNFTGRNLLYYALIKQAHPTKEVAQYVLYTGKKAPTHVGKPIRDRNVTYRYEVIHLPSLSVQDFLGVNDLRAFAFAAATLKNDKQFDIFIEKFVTLVDFTEYEVVKDAFAVLEALMPEPVFTKFNTTMRQKTAPVSKLWEEIEREMEEKISKGIEQGIAKRVEQGIAQGIEQGIAQGIEQGVEQGATQERLAVAKALLTEGLSEALVMKTTKLSAEEVQKLARQLKR